MAAIITNAVRAKQASDAAYERQLRGMRGRSFVAVPFRWQTQQDRFTVTFPVYGRLPHDCVAWRRDGQMLPWCCGREGDEFLIEAGHARRLGLA